MMKELIAENRSRLYVALTALAVLTAVLLLVWGVNTVSGRQSDAAVTAALQELTYTERRAAEEMQTLEALRDRDGLSVGTKKRLYVALAELSYMTGDDRVYNRNVAYALFYADKDADDEAVVYLTNKFIGRLYANGCYDSAEELLGELGEKFSIAEFSAGEQAAYYLSLADVEQMLGKDASELLAKAQASVGQMSEGGMRLLNQAKLDLLTARGLINTGDLAAAETLMAGYSEEDDFGLGADQVYVVCDYRIPYDEIAAKLALYRGDTEAAQAYADAYLTACDTYSFRTMKLRMLLYMAQNAEGGGEEATESYAATARAVSQQNLEQMTAEYGRFLLTDIDATTLRLTEQTKSQERGAMHRLLLILAVYVLILAYGLGILLLSYMNKDGLTRLGSRKQYERERIVCEKRHVPYCLAMLDIDDFKKINDTYGHAAGDEVLCAIAGILRSYTGRGIKSYRYGGEEMCMVMCRVPEQRGREIAEEIRARVEKEAGQGELHVTVSIGLSVSAAGENVFQEADRQLYEVKRGGKNQVR